MAAKQQSVGGGFMNTKIANRIYIDDPSDEVVDWVEANLKFPNPEYAKKQRMGFWTGKTPKNLQLYEWNGNQLIIPFGVCREIMPMLRGTRVWCDFRQDNVISYGGESIPLYDYQRVACTAMIKSFDSMKPKIPSQAMNWPSSESSTI